MAFKQPNLIFSSDPAIAGKAQTIVRRYRRGHSATDTYKVLGMEEDWALIKRNSFSYNGRSYSGSVYLVDTLNSGINGSGRPGLDKTVHVCGKNGFCVEQDYAGGYGRLTAAILAELIAAAPDQFAAWQEERKAKIQERKEAREAREAQDKQAEARAEKWDALAVKHKECFDHLMTAVAEVRAGRQHAGTLPYLSFRLADVVQAQADFGPRALPTEEG